jgi:NTP pyrophosphatase (non-canonical NTP hydrolase)
MIAYAELRNANLARQKEWDTGGNIDLSYAGNELAGEVSEAIAEAVEEDGPYIDALADELSDVVICVDLIGIQAGTASVDWTTNDTALSPEHAQTWVNELASDLQLVCNTIKKLERERHGMVGSRATLDDLEHGLRLVQFDATLLARCHGIDLKAAVANKFNHTSVKYGLTTRMYN